MAYRLGDYVVYGELRNKRNYSTHGLIALRREEEGKETLLRLELTGNCCDDIRGKTIRFFPKDMDAPGPIFDCGEHCGFQIRQIGPTGEMSSEGWVRTVPGPVEEYARRAELGEPPPTPWVRRLYLEWYGQNGRVVIEMADPVVEECVREGERGDEGDWVPLPNNATHPDSGWKPPCDLGLTAIERDGEEANTEPYRSCDADLCGEDDAFVDSLQRELDAEAAAIDRSIRENSFEDDDCIREMELMDDCMEHGVPHSLASMLGDSEVLPPPDDFSDEEVEARLKSVLMRLAKLGVKLDVCEHYTPRACYILLRETILPEGESYPELVGTGWVTHLSTSDDCPECDAQFEKEFEEWEKQRENTGQYQRREKRLYPDEEGPWEIEDDCPF
ncbi:MAG: hypothetical protein RBU21_01405 [FCB group bacterium]|jgi:hypothetical protein|nr:hypothetical protein [FCB group bacterium]